MPNTREKLIEVKQTLEMCYKQGITSECNGCAYRGHNNVCMDALMEDALAVINQLESNATVQEWTSVKDGLPELIPCDAGTAYSEAVNVLTTGRKVLTAIWDGIDWICDAEFWDAEDEEITHWTPVLLPLHQPPEGE